MGKYEGLTAFLRNVTDSVTITFQEMAGIIHSELPPSALTQRPWWSNSNTNSYSKHWLAAGCLVGSVDMRAGTVSFIRNDEVAHTILTETSLNARRTLRRTYAFRYITEQEILDQAAAVAADPTYGAEGRLIHNALVRFPQNDDLIKVVEPTESITLTNMCMIYDAAGNVLVEEKEGKDYKGLIFPGGHVEKHEPITDSVIREIQEETGLKISNLKLCGIKDWIEKNGSRYMVFLYKTNTFSGELTSSAEGNVFWMPIEELRQKRALWHLSKMMDIFCGDQFSELYFDYDGSNYEPELK